MTVKSIRLWRLKQMKTSSLSLTAWLSESTSRKGLGNGFWIDTGNTRLLSVKVKCPDPWVASHDQKPDMEIVSGIKALPLARTPPPPHGIYIGRCITVGYFLKLSFIYYHRAIMFHKCLGKNCGQLENCMQMFVQMSILQTISVRRRLRTSISPCKCRVASTARY